LNLIEVIFRIAEAAFRFIAKSERMCYNTGHSLQQEGPVNMAELTRQDVIKIVASSHQPICLRGVDLSGLDLSFLDLSRVNFSYANLEKANLTQAWLQEAALFSANLAGANLTGAILHHADLIGANLSGADLRQADLNQATLCGAILSGANLREIQHDGTDFDGVQVSTSTIWPAGFDQGQYILFIESGGCPQPNHDGNRIYSPFSGA
jgi:uncharacterized protein YjbI with pentapeptide repeats